MIRICFFILAFPFILNAQSIEIKDASGNAILYFEEDRLLDAETKKPFVTVKGNTIFDGASEEKQDILLLVTVQDIFSKRKPGYALNSDQSEAVFSILNGSFFYKESKGKMAYYRKENDGSFTLYQFDSDSVLCRFTGSLSTGKLSAIFYYFMRKLELDRIVKEYLRDAPQPPQKDITATSGSISRLWNTGLDEFIWDGNVFKRRWNSFDYEEWTFDGVTLKRLWYPGDEEFIWDGKILKRKWYPSMDEFEWNGTILRRRFGSAADEFIIQGNIVKRYFGSDNRDEWQVDGEVPIPLIAIVVFGLLRK